MFRDPKLITRESRPNSTTMCPGSICFALDQICYICTHSFNHF
uniref:Uncharacterized protein n=1 Tax=Rhizophora mucronata TaxID=61149 RepID=A0A2P2JBE0_RHIMU